MSDFEALRDCLRSLHIAHHIKGRIRFKLDPSASVPNPSSARLQALQAVVDRIPGVRSVNFNLLARSCTVTYDPLAIPHEAWGDLLAGRDTAAAAMLERILYDTYQEVGNAKL